MGLGGAWGPSSPGSCDVSRPRDDDHRGGGGVVVQDKVCARRCFPRPFSFQGRAMLCIS
ncbi:hypothetical protein M408DRAFT_333831 [Serendipita vermifera MAFF 305830]|uniref:Uncharacterized protein n=1 Tax=Serendipita vermifera MAFF 305830 TaxID=933852 RepID=A0A0C3ANC3_SERVB|nr:hypothetical protein M408DRAFT_333831 [Serendipita vermifera MAFF 305830]